MSARRGKARHKWIKLRLHVYICRECGAGKVNAQLPNGDWAVTYHLPSGNSRTLPRTPVCEPGPLTAKYLAKYDFEIRELSRGVRPEASS